jgi:hypothetical protein
MYCQTVANDFDEYQFCRDKSLSDLFSLEGLLTAEQYIDFAWFKPKKD